MKAAKADRSGTFDHITLNLSGAPTVVRPRGFHLSPRGMTFHSDRRLAPWTEVEVEVEAPGDSQKRRTIRCAGIVVQCEASPRRAGYDITLLFLELNKRTLADLGKISTHHTHSAAHRNAVVGFRV
ncbi:MAG: hypothetical protein NTY01_02705 [Verrucomicrobia bacterium]|nr:hypothetical protein [Verrucomicrobiota bacterium]